MKNKYFIIINIISIIVSFYFLWFVIFEVIAPILFEIDSWSLPFWFWLPTYMILTMILIAIPVFTLVKLNILLFDFLSDLGIREVGVEDEK